MNLRELIKQLVVINQDNTDPDIDVILHIDNEDGTTFMANVSRVTLEDDHGTEKLFVRLAGENNE